MHQVVADKQSWEFVEGHEIAPGRTVLKPLGGGHDYEVYLVWDDHLFSIMVAKLLRPDRFDDAKALRSLEREAAALDRLAHPTLLRGFDAVLDGPFPHVLVEHLEGPSLRRLIRRSGPLSLQQVLPLALSVASAVHYMHAEGYVHLDIKPDNIVVGIPPRLIDFSLVRSLRRARRITGWIGTRAYMPPEQCAPGEAGEIGPWSDVWGLGATLYHAVSGKRPFSRGSPDTQLSREERFPQLVEEVRPWAVRVAPELSQTVLACLSRNPDERPSAAELALSLEPLVAALPAKLRLSRGGRT
jgi:eukaryotic-like serine/threonine-protein kinase